MVVRVYYDTGTSVMVPLMVPYVKCSICGKEVAAVHIIYAPDGEEFLAFCDECYREIFSFLKLYIEMARGDKAIRRRAEG